MSVRAKGVPEPTFQEPAPAPAREPSVKARTSAKVEPVVETIDPSAGSLRTFVEGTPTTEPLTDAQVAYLRSELGADVDLAEVQTRWERLGDVRLVVLEVVRERLAAFQAGPAQFSLAGVYSQSTGENIRALREQLARVVGEDPSTTVAEVSRTRTRSRRAR